ncbi:MAG TPA: restriction endonuclease [Candidatus Binataceae bacterium]|nr:restriction endonuclease [Candidatus Binataceae bacterium]
MAVPTYDAMMLPLLRMIADGKEHSLEECGRELSAQLRLTPEDLALLLPSGRQKVFYNRVWWAKKYLRKAGLLEITGRGKFRIADRGKDILRRPPERINLKFLYQFPDFVEFHKPRPRVQDRAHEELPVDTSEDTPEEILEDAYQSLRESLANDPLSRVRVCSPQFFERLVVDLLLAMGYGGSRAEAGRTVGQSGDGGIDGIIDEDRLGLDKVCIQAKRWENTVGRPIVQAFAGSLEGRGATKGVLITTSDFSRDAQDYVGKIQKRIVLIDGRLLSKLLIDYGVGVSRLSAYEIKKIDLDYFEEAE